MRTSVHAAQTKTQRQKNIISLVIHRKRYVGSLCLMFDQTLFACLATPCCVKRGLSKVQFTAISCGIHTDFLSQYSNKIFV